MQQQQIIENPEFAPSFSIYSSNSVTSRALAKVIREQDLARFHQNGDIDDFEFSLTLSDEEDSRRWTFFNRDLLINDEIERQGSHSSYYSSSEADEFESPRSGTKCKKSSSTGSGSKRWIFRYFLRRSNSEGKHPMVLKKVDSPKHKRNSDEMSKVGVHEQFYVQKRAESEMGKRKSFLPYRKDLMGLFANVNGMGKMLPF